MMPADKKPIKPFPTPFKIIESAGTMLALAHVLDEHTRKSRGNVVSLPRSTMLMVARSLRNSAYVVDELVLEIECLFLQTDDLP